MIGFVPDPRRVDYWTSYSGPKSVAELKTRPIWNTFSDEKKARLEKLDETRAERLRAYHEMCDRFNQTHSNKDKSCLALSQIQEE